MYTYIHLYQDCAICMMPVGGSSDSSARVVTPCDHVFHQVCVCARRLCILVVCVCVCVSLCIQSIQKCVLNMS